MCGAMLEPAADAAPAAWLQDEIRDFDHTVGSIVPAGFEAYARVFHPAWLSEPGGGETPVRWSTVAAARGTTLHPIAEWGGVAGRWREPGEPGLWDREPEHGSLDAAALAALSAVLGPHTTTPESCWFAIGEGYGDTIGRLIAFSPGTPPEERDRITAEIELEAMRADMRRAEAPTFTLPNRPMLLLRGPLDAMGEDEPLAGIGLGRQSPSIWWPDDRSWCVGSEIDLMTTYVAGSAACIEAICSTPGLEALPASVDQRVTWDSDTVNPLPRLPG